MSYAVPFQRARLARTIGHLSPGREHLTGLSARSEPTTPRAEREAIAKLALGDMDAFVARAAADVGFPFESEALGRIPNCG